MAKSPERQFNRSCTYNILLILSWLVIARGKVIGLHIENAGTKFGSTVINDNNKPDIKIVEGQN